jgi:hypothetical protein
LTAPERAPQIRTASLLGMEQSYLEGMRLEHTGLLTGAFDYWRIYDCGIAITAESYHEDYATLRQGGPPHLSPLQILVKLHSLLAHARLLGQESPGVQQVIVRMDWRGLAGRVLMWDTTHVVSPVMLRGFIAEIGRHRGRCARHPSTECPTSSQDDPRGTQDFVQRLRS